MIKIYEDEEVIATRYYYEQFSKPIILEKVDSQKEYRITVKYTNFPTSIEQFEYFINIYS